MPESTVHKALMEAGARKLGPGSQQGEDAECSNSGVSNSCSQGEPRSILVQPHDSIHKVCFISKPRGTSVGDVSSTERLEFGPQSPGMCCGQVKASNLEQGWALGVERRHWDKPVLLILLDFFNHFPVLEYLD